MYGATLCNSCISSFPKAPPIAHAYHHACFSYTHPFVRTAIHQLKYKQQRTGAEALLRASLPAIRRYVLEHITSDTQSLCFVPIPITTKAFHDRGFNQSILLCKMLTTHMKGSATAPLLRTHSHHRQAQSISKEQRLSQRIGTMSLNHPPLEHLHYIIIDDVTTSGATFLEAQRVFAQYGITPHCIALAHG